MFSFATAMPRIDASARGAAARALALSNPA
jgi:hypothetical protein